MDGTCWPHSSAPTPAKGISSIVAWGVILILWAVLYVKDVSRSYYEVRWYFCPCASEKGLILSYVLIKEFLPFRNISTAAEPATASPTGWVPDVRWPRLQHKQPFSPCRTLAHTGRNQLHCFHNPLPCQCSLCLLPWAILRGSKSHYFSNYKLSP